MAFDAFFLSAVLSEIRETATGARVETLYSCHTLSRTDFEAGETYLSLMTRNLNVIREALN